MAIAEDDLEIVNDNDVMIMRKLINVVSQNYYQMRTIVEGDVSTAKSDRDVAESAEVKDLLKAMITLQKRSNFLLAEAFDIEKTDHENYGGRQ